MFVHTLLASASSSSALWSASTQEQHSANSSHNCNVCAYPRCQLILLLCHLKCKYAKTKAFTQELIVNKSLAYLPGFGHVSCHLKYKCEQHSTSISITPSAYPPRLLIVILLRPLKCKHTRTTCKSALLHDPSSPSSAPSACLVPPAFSSSSPPLSRGSEMQAYKSCIQPVRSQRSAKFVHTITVSPAAIFHSEVQVEPRYYNIALQWGKLIRLREADVSLATYWLSNQSTQCWYSDLCNVLLTTIARLPQLNPRVRWMIRCACTVFTDICSNVQLCLVLLLYAADSYTCNDPRSRVSAHVMLNLIPIVSEKKISFFGIYFIQAKLMVVNVEMYTCSKKYRVSAELL